MLFLLYGGVCPWFNDHFSPAKIAQKCETHSVSGKKYVAADSATVFEDAYYKAQAAAES